MTTDALRVPAQVKPDQDRVRLIVFDPTGGGAGFGIPMKLLEPQAKFPAKALQLGKHVSGQDAGHPARLDADPKSFVGHSADFIRQQFAADDLEVAGRTRGHDVGCFDGLAGLLDESYILPFHLGQIACNPTLRGGLGLTGVKSQPLGECEAEEDHQSGGVLTGESLLNVSFTDEVHLEVHRSCGDHAGAYPLVHDREAGDCRRNGKTTKSNLALSGFGRPDV